MAIATLVLGGTGYVSGELLRLLAVHPEFELLSAVSASRSDTPIADTFPHLGSAYRNVRFASLEDWPHAAEGHQALAVFSAAPHGASAALVKRVLDEANHNGIDARVVDCSADFRYSNDDSFAAVYGVPHSAPALLDHFICGLPEHVAETPQKHIGHPGCFATAMLLAAVPLFASQLVQGPLFVSATTGSTGSGRSPQAGTHHPERHSNMYAYKPLSHRHTPEVMNLIKQATGVHVPVHFVPHSGPFARGIYATVQATLTAGTTASDVRASFEQLYRDRAFIEIVAETPKIKNVAASNYAHIGIATSGDSVAVTCAIDNLLKGAAGGAMQWMNRLWDLPETTGLTNPSPAWT